MFIISNLPPGIYFKLDAMALKDSLELTIGSLNFNLKAFVVVWTAGVSNNIGFSLKRFILKQNK